MSSRFSRPSEAHCGTGTGVGVGSAGSSPVGCGLVAGPAGVATGSKLASGITKPVSGLTKMFSAASYALTPTIVSVP
jgi:hypothetical protein